MFSNPKVRATCQIMKLITTGQKTMSTRTILDFVLE